MNRENRLEWAAVAISAAMILAITGYLLLEGTRADEPADPQVTLRISEARASGTSWLVPAEVVNTGGVATVALVVEATAIVDGEMETSEVTLDYVAGGSVVELEFAFSGPPDEPPEARVVGYQLP